MKLQDLLENIDIDLSDDEHQIAAIKQYGSSMILQHIKKPSELVQLAAVKKDPWAIKDLVEQGISPSESVQLAAVTSNGFMIQFITDPSEAVQLAAFKNNNWAALDINNKISKRALNIILTDESFIRQKPKYDTFVKKSLKDNSVLMNKWLRYAENIREME